VRVFLENQEQHIPYFLKSQKFHPILSPTLKKGKTTRRSSAEKCSSAEMRILEKEYKKPAMKKIKF
jgi:hypothetical protein